MKNIALVVGVFISMGCVATSSTSRTSSVTLKDGTVLQGVIEVFESQPLETARDVSVFYGIPYAEPPVGSLRFKPPVPVSHIESPFSASKVGSSCLQSDVGEIFELVNGTKSEDCLTLNVFVPKPSRKTRAVLVWMHGGFLLYGAGQMTRTATLSLPAYGDIIVVTINYRLGAFGFLTSGDDLIPGNLGLRDQQLALKWVHENIQAFRGDPSRITIMGQGAGAVSVGYHILSPVVKACFRMRLWSGSPNYPLRSELGAAYHRKEVQTLAKLVGCSEDELEDDKRLLICLQEAPTEDIIENLAMAQQELGVLTRAPIETIVDGVFLPKDAISMLKDGSLNVENLLIGSNADEGTLQLVPYFGDMEVKPFVNSTTFDKYLSNVGLNHLLLRDIVETFYVPKAKDLGKKSRDYFRELSEILSDIMITCGVSEFAKAAAASSSSPADVYQYRMTFQPSNSFTGALWTGSSYGDEVQYVFGAPFEEQLFKKTTGEEKEFSRMVMKHWSNFVKTGDPNKGYEDDEKKLPWWPKITAKEQLYKDLSTSMNVIKNTKQKECHLINNIVPPLKKALEELDKLKNEKDEKSRWSREGQCVGDDCHEH